MGVAVQPRRAVAAAGAAGPRRPPRCTCSTPTTPTAAWRVLAPRREGVEYDVEPAADRFLDRAQHRHPGRRPRLGAVRRHAAHEQWVPLAGLGRGRAVRGRRRVRRRHRARACAPAGSPRCGCCPATRARPPATASRGTSPSTSRCTRSAWATTPSRPSAPSRSSSSRGPPRAPCSTSTSRTRERTLLKRQPVLGDFDAANYAEHREWATAADGTRVPISVVRRVGARGRRHQPRACSTATAPTRSPPTRTSRWRGSPCSTAASSTPSRTCAAAARWAGAGTTTASCSRRPTPSPTSLACASTTSSRRAGSRRTGSGSKVVRPAGC